MRVSASNNGIIWVSCCAAHAAWTGHSSTRADTLRASAPSRVVHGGEARRSALPLLFLVSPSLFLSPTLSLSLSLSLISPLSLSFVLYLSLSVSVYLPLYLSRAVSLSLSLSPLFLRFVSLPRRLMLSLRRRECKSSAVNTSCPWANDAGRDVSGPRFSGVKLCAGCGSLQSINRNNNI